MCYQSRDVPLKSLHTVTRDAGVRGDSKEHDFLSLSLLSVGGSSFASKPSTPTGLGGGFPPLSSPQKASPQPMGGGWQQGGGYNWQQTQSKPQPSMPHASPQHRPNYNVSFSSMPGGQNERGKGSANVGKDDGREPDCRVPGCMCV